MENAFVNSICKLGSSHKKAEHLNNALHVSGYWDSQWCERLFFVARIFIIRHEGTKIDVCLSDELLVLIDNNDKANGNVNNKSKSNNNKSIKKSSKRPKFLSDLCYWLVASFVLLCLLSLITLFLTNRWPDFLYGSTSCAAGGGTLWLKKTWSNGPPPTWA